MMPNSLWIVSELYYPEETSTGYFLTKIAEGLSPHFPVRVLCTQPTYSARGKRAPSREIHKGVAIRRCRGTTLDKDVFLFRIANLVTISLSIFLHALRCFRKGDIVLVATNPPVLPFLTELACRLRGAKCVLLIQDVYPDTLVAAGLFDRGSFPVQVLERLTRILYRDVNCISVLGRDMEALVRKKMNGSSHGKIVVIRNWADVDQVVPDCRARNGLLEQLGIARKFVLQYAGNMGRVHGIEILFGAAERVSAMDEDIHFLFIGSGAKKEWLEESVRKRDLHNVTVFPNRPRSDQQVFLNACDVAITAFVPGMAGVGVPSRMYNIFAAGKPIIAAVDEESELALVVREEGLGWIVPPGDPERFAEAVMEARSRPDLVADMGKRARAVAESKYPMHVVIDAYRELVGGLDGGSSRFIDAGISRNGRAGLS